ncbi:MAG: TetR/AcrR family transcriptional regulator [Oscillospiraceae bacterium]|nr:TetR/AcrR family transcriptional regulator [Oscillospiraceae bacterium]
MPRNKYPEETVKKILDAALKLFLEKGYEQTTILDIVAEMKGLTRGAFYHHFKSKEDVLEAVTEMIFCESNPFEKVKQEKGLSGLGKIKLALKYSSVQGYVDERAIALNKIAIPLLSNPRFLSEQIKSTRYIAGFVEALIEEGMADGSIARGNAKFLGELFMLLFNVWIVPSIFPCSLEEAWEKILIIKKTFEALGLPVIDEEMLESLQNVVIAYE